MNLQEEQGTRGMDKRGAELNEPCAVISPTGLAARQELLISSTFTDQPLEPALVYLLDLLNLPLGVRFAPYNQVFQQLLDPSSMAATNAMGVNMFAVRLEDFMRDQRHVVAPASMMAKIGRDLLDALRTFAHRVRVPTLLAMFPPSPRVVGDAAEAVMIANAFICAEAVALPGVVVLRPDELGCAERRLSADYDALSDELAHVPFTDEYYASFALSIARHVHTLCVPARKVLVLDCDNTIWRGVVGEEGTEGILLSPASLRLQEFAVDAQAQGALICVASKNAERDVLEVFEKRRDMLLTSEHIVAHRINWEAKPRNLISLARELNLGLDSFVFLDDSPVECAQMRSELPQVVTLQVPPDDAVESFLAHLWVFDKMAVTEEDAKRTRMYRENSARQQYEENSSDLGEFFASLNLEIDIKPPEDHEWSRVAQLSQRTNQFNFTAVRRTEAELRAIASGDDSRVLRVKVRDRFGDYGLVGLVVAHMTADALVIDIMLLSCRVLGRGVEHAMLRLLGALANEEHRAWVNLIYRQTSKNEPARAFADSVASNFRTTVGVDAEYLIPVEKAMAIAHRPGFDPAAVVKARRSDETTAIASVAASAMSARSDRYQLIAGELHSGAAVLAALRAARSRQRILPTVPQKAESPGEAALLALWEDLLGVQGLGVEDDFFALGGNSLLVARMFSEIERRHGVRLRMTAILDAPTVRRLARQIHPNRAAGSGVLIDLKPGDGPALFLVHDGDGETMLYRNLAGRMPLDMAVVGIEPRSLPGIPLAHDSIEGIAACYVDAIRGRQPSGPYLLGGMCAGGLIAYEMALQLSNAGQLVNLIAMFDAATPQAPHRPARGAKARAARIAVVLETARQTHGNLLHRWSFLTMAFAGKAVNALLWQLSSRLRHLTTRWRFFLLTFMLRRGKAWPRAVPELSVREIYGFAEGRYRPARNDKVPVLLFRATVGDGGDTPYQDIYADEDLGWKSVAGELAVVDVAGGHASMLQEPFVQSLGELLRSKAVAARNAKLDPSPHA